MILAGTPPTITLLGTSLVTNAPAAIMEPSPMVTPGRIVTLSQYILHLIYQVLLQLPLLHFYTDSYTTSL